MLAVVSEGLSIVAFCPPGLHTSGPWGDLIDTTRCDDYHNQLILPRPSPLLIPPLPHEASYAADRCTLPPALQVYMHAIYSFSLLTRSALMAGTALSGWLCRPGLCRGGATARLAPSPSQLQQQHGRSRSFPSAVGRAGDDTIRLT